MRSDAVRWDEFPCCVYFYLWSCIIPKGRMDGCECGSLSHNVLHTPWWDTGTSIWALSPGWQLRVTAISFAYSNVCTYAKTHSHSHTAGSETGMYGFDLDPSHLNADPWCTARRVVLVMHRMHAHRQTWIFWGGFDYTPVKVYESCSVFF